MNYYSHHIGDYITARLAFGDSVFDDWFVHVTRDRSVTVTGYVTKSVTPPTSLQKVSTDGGCH